MNDYTTLNIAELMFQYGVALHEYNKAYVTKKNIEDEIVRRYKSKLDMSIATGGRCGIPEAIASEMEEVYEENC